MKMKKILTSVLVASALSTALFAGPNSSGAYVGLGYGTTAYNDGDYLKEELKIDNLETKDSGYKVYGGYQFNNVVGIEAAYTDYGKFTADNDFAMASTAFSVAANLGYSFLDGQLRPFGTVGLSYISSDYSNYPTSLDQYTLVTPPANNHGAFHYGLGIQYEPDALIGFGFRLAYEADVYAITIQRTGASDKTYAQGLGTVYLGVQYKF